MFVSFFPVRVALLLGRRIQQAEPEFKVFIDERPLSVGQPGLLDSFGGRTVGRPDFDGLAGAADRGSY